MLLAAARAMGRLRIVRNLPNIGSLIRLRVVWRLFLANTSSDTGAFRYEAGTGIDGPGGCIPATSIVITRERRRKHR